MESLVRFTQQHAKVVKDETTSVDEKRTLHLANLKELETAIGGMEAVFGLAAQSIGNQTKVTTSLTVHLPDAIEKSLDILFTLPEAAPLLLTDACVDLLVQGLLHERDTLRLLILTRLNIWKGDKDRLSLVVGHPKLFPALLYVAVHCADTTVAAMASAFCELAWSQTEQGWDQIFKREAMQGKEKATSLPGVYITVHEAVTENVLTYSLLVSCESTCDVSFAKCPKEIAELRMFTLFMKVAVRSEEAFHSFVQHGWIGALEACCRREDISSDVLILMSHYEAIGDMFTLLTRASLDTLITTTSLVRSVVALLPIPSAYRTFKGGATEETSVFDPHNPFAGMLMGACLQTLEHLLVACQMCGCDLTVVHASLGRAPFALTTLFKVEEDVAVLASALNCVGALAASQAGLLLLYNPQPNLVPGKDLPALLTVVAKHTWSTGYDKLKVCALEAAARVLCMVSGDEGVESVQKAFYQQLAVQAFEQRGTRQTQSSTGLLLELTNSQTPLTQQAAVHVMRGAAHHTWGCCYVLDEPSCLQFVASNAYDTLREDRLELANTLLSFHTWTLGYSAAKAKLELVVNLSHSASQAHVTASSLKPQVRTQTVSM